MVTNVVLPARVRGILYLVFSVLGVGLGATQIGYSAASYGQPTWLTVALAVFAFVGTAFGITAASNVKVADRAKRNAKGQFIDD